MHCMKRCARRGSASKPRPCAGRCARACSVRTKDVTSCGKRADQARKRHRQRRSDSGLPNERGSDALHRPFVGSTRRGAVLQVVGKKELCPSRAESLRRGGVTPRKILGDRVSWRVHPCRSRNVTTEILMNSRSGRRPDYRTPEISVVTHVGIIWNPKYRPISPWLLHYLGERVSSA